MVTETKDEVKAKAREILDNFLEAKNHRKTPERHAILDTIYDLRHHFTLEELGEENVDIIMYDKLGHGFGLGDGTAAEGWLPEAVAFWEKHR